ncbi:RHOMBOID-like protein 5 [Cucumis melo var. makuwa]|uniref:RHOMBOID-like protein n=1 Tax=Cucumis melo var. makuwa TaxID=1194695 RepID=A0A5D3CF93_CUCMM|nr:RHOMBOID-like protein 5 [Cucumis melo var. makuwa]
MGKRPPSVDMESMSYNIHKPITIMPPPPSYYPPPPKPWFPWLVPLIFLVNVGMFIFTLYKNNCPAITGGNRCLLYPELGRFSFQPFHENPLLGPTISIYGALDKEAVVERGEGWRLVSCTWLHAGVIHLLANMLSLLFIGVRLEQEFGFSENPTISVGASGALFGLLGAMLSELITNWTIYANKCAALMSLILIIALNLAVGFVPHVDNSAHIGGFISGFLLGFILLIRPQFGYVNHKYIPPGSDVKRKSKHKCYQYFLLIVALLLLVFGYISGLTKLYRTGPIQVSKSNRF